MVISQKQFGILGMARSGLAAADKLSSLGAQVFLSDCQPAANVPQSQSIQDKFECEFGEHTKRLLQCDYLIVSPGIPLDIPILKLAQQKKIEVLGEIELGYRIKSPDSKIIAITGSNGKSTTVSLIHHILMNAGKKSILSGNIGSALTSFPIEQPGIDFIVLELSSFQLELVSRFHAEIAAILNITPDHINRYASMENYAQTKFKIFQNQTESDLAILNLADHFSQKFKGRILAKTRQFHHNGTKDIRLEKDILITDNTRISLQKSRLKGPHNLENMMAAILSLDDMNLPRETIEDALATFQPLPHRMELVVQFADRRFYNDSKATNTDAVKFALMSFEKPVLLIMGGAGKGEDYSVLKEIIRQKVKKLYLVGKSRYKMATVFQDIIDLEVFRSFESLVSKAYQDSEPGDDILLSPACTSYDMFSNFEERGKYFRKLVLELQK
jgi:UDP-N-acetylmuramoylalanine--D-glutamate ligase